MSYLVPEAAKLAESLRAASAYAKTARVQLDKAAAEGGEVSPGKVRHLQAIEAAVQGAIEFATAANNLLNPAPPPLVAHVRSLPAFQNNLERIGYPHHIREALALFSAHHLPRNPYLDELFGPAKHEPSQPMGEQPASREAGPPASPAGAG